LKPNYIGAIEQEDYEADILMHHKALMARMKMVKFSDSHRNSEEFPYTAEDLA